MSEKTTEFMPTLAATTGNTGNTWQLAQDGDDEEPRRLYGGQITLSGLGPDVVYLHLTAVRVLDERGSEVWDSANADEYERRMESAGGCSNAQAVTLTGWPGVWVIFADPAEA